MDGFEALAEIRKHSRVPVIMLTACGGEYDKLFCNDYAIEEMYSWNSGVIV